jgi:hypothetical protein
MIQLVSYPVAGALQGGLWMVARPSVFCKGKVGQFLTETFTKEHIDKNEPIPEK